MAQEDGKMASRTLCRLTAVLIATLLAGCAANDLPPGSPGSAMFQVHGQVVTSVGVGAR
jgi:hypothetical protein